jgi:thioredoxin-dependent peroxiredoxin
MMLEIGVQAPEFSVTAHDGSTMTLSDFRGKKVLLWFYPKANTGG